EDNVERQAKPVGHRQRRQPIVQPSNFLAGVKSLGRFAHAVSGFDRHDLETESTQPGGVAARSRPDVEGQAVGAVRQDIQKVAWTPSACTCSYRAASASAASSYPLTGSVT